MEPHTRLRGHPVSLRCRWVFWLTCVNIYQEMSGLTIRATVSHWTVCSFHILPSRWLALEISLSLRRPIRRASAIRNTFFDIRRRRVDASLEPLPLHDRLPSPTGFSFRVSVFLETPRISILQCNDCSAIDFQNQPSTLGDTLQRTDALLLIAHLLAPHFRQVHVMIKNLIAAVPGNGFQFCNVTTVL